MDGGLVEVVRIADAVEAGHRRHDDDVAPSGQQGGRSAEPEFLDFVVDAEVFLDIGVGGRQVGLGLVVVVVGNEILDEVLGKERFELAVELGGEGLVVAEDEGGAVELGDDVGHREGLPGAGHAHECSRSIPLADRRYDLPDGLRLVPGRLIRCYQLKIHVLLGLCPTRAVGESTTLGSKPRASRP